MFEITFNDADRMHAFQDCGKVYKDAEYDFTFEGRFIIYHCDLVGTLAYIALDMETGLGSVIVRRLPGKYVGKNEYRSLMPHILSSIKYTGDSRYCSAFAERPLEVIDSIFRVVLPEYGYNIREEQIVLAKNMYKGLTNKSVSVCEAEVGTGKTLAYLIASLVAKNNNSQIYGTWYPVTITTSSIELQKALVEKEIPQLSKMLRDFFLIDQPLTCVLRKGKEHYFCRRRFEDLIENMRMNKYAAVIESFERARFADKAFDLDAVNLRPSLKAKICVKGSCRKCKYADDCRYRAFMDQVYRRCDVDFQITNHNLYLTSEKMRREATGRLLKPSNYVIVDEAHKLRDAAQEVFGARLCETDIPGYVNIVKHYGWEEATMLYKESLKQLLDLNRDLFKKAGRMIDANDTDEGRGTLVELGDEDKTLISRLVALLDQVEKTRKKISGELEGRGRDLLQILRSFIRTNNINVWVESDENGLRSLCNSARNIGAVLYDTIWQTPASFVLTSGTMSDGTDFTYFDQENGIKRINRHLVQHTTTESPFRYDQNARLYIPKDMPLPDNDNAEYIKAVADQVVQLVEATHGHTAILFTSYKVLSAVYEMTKEQLSKYEVFQMTRKNNTVITEFKKSKNGILFASGSMWEGVDCVGDCLSSVIIVRLPFPMRSAMMEQKKGECCDLRKFVREFALPEMLIKLRQGVGRLIRSEHDTGLVSILDSRAYEGVYANKVKAVMKKYPRVYSMEEIREYFHAVKPVEYFMDEKE